MPEIFYRFRVEGVRTSPGNPTMVVKRYQHFFTEPRLATVSELNGIPDSAVGFSLNVKVAKEYYAEIEKKIKELKQAETMVEYHITDVQFMVDGEVFATTKMATPARTSLVGATLFADVRRELNAHLDKQPAAI